MQVFLQFRFGVSQGLGRTRAAERPWERGWAGFGYFLHIIWLFRAQTTWQPWSRCQIASCLYGPLRFESSLSLRTHGKVQTHRTRFDNATRFLDFHWPITLILVWIFRIFRSAVTFWVIWSTYLSKFALIGCFVNFQKLKNREPKLMGFLETGTPVFSHR